MTSNDNALDELCTYNPVLDAILQLIFHSF